MRKGDLLELEITGYAYEGKGIAKITKEFNSPDEPAVKKFVVFVEKAYPGDRVIAEIRKIKKSYAEARIKSLISSSQYRITPKCSYFGVCGGCKAQNLSYKQQLNFKQDQVKDIFEHLGGLSNFEVLQIVSSSEIFFYRNKLEFSFADKRWLTEQEISSMQEIQNRNFALGFHIPGIYDKVLDLKECWLQSETSNEILNFTREFFYTRTISIYSIQNREGLLRNLVIKQSRNTNDLMVNLVVSRVDDQILTEYKNELLKAFPQITTLIFNINEKKALIATGDYEIVAHGEGFIYDFIGNYKFRISANSFFQTNTEQAEKLFTVALQFANFNGSEIVYDLYSGAGTIPIFISKSVKEVYGFESVESAIADAQVNIGLNRTNNFFPNLTDLNKSFLSLLKEKSIPRPDLIISDPPRSGMHPKTIEDILILNPAKIVYISCNPSTQARDLKLLAQGGYRLVKIQPIDMFPHTYHIENVALLIKEES
jgi:23S rRNA (uracil1939-C5)-methyltransferase